ncbi:MAG: methyltransferase domain-containing protein [Desulfatibacillaceae bacterium]|nr:methyltransferase domain-containing protein [Desulfatibacillaceae bacterium]
MPTSAEITRDAVLGGALCICQEKHGYRFSVDSLLLANFVRLGANDAVCELGAGCGVVLVVLAHLHPGVKLYGVEIQRPLFELALQNAAQNSFEKRIVLACGDFRDLPFGPVPDEVDAVVANPPFYKIGSGRSNPSTQKALARHEFFAKLGQVLETAARLLPAGGRFFAVYPASRIVGLLASAREKGLEPKRLRLVHSRVDAPASMVLVEAVKNSKEDCLVEPPLVLYQKPGCYSDEACEILYGKMDRQPGTRQGP